jgi:hypothetical protein
MDKAVSTHQSFIGPETGIVNAIIEGFSIVTQRIPGFKPESKVPPTSGRSVKPGFFQLKPCGSGVSGKIQKELFQKYECVVVSERKIQVGPADFFHLAHIRKVVPKISRDE